MYWGDFVGKGRNIFSSNSNLLPLLFCSGAVEFPNNGSVCIFPWTVFNRVKLHVLLHQIRPRDENFRQGDSVLGNVKTSLSERSPNVLFFLSWAEAYLGTDSDVFYTVKRGSRSLL